MNNYEAAQTRLATIADETASLMDLNEATARFQIIDRVLMEVFGWDRLGIDVEKYQRGDFTDYECGKPVKMLVEAKRESIGFELPSDLNKNILKVSTLVENNSNFAHAIEQAVGYCQKRGIPFATISNGRQWVFMLGARTDGITADQGKCVAYSSLSNLHENFREAWNLMTPEALAGGALITLLTKTSTLPPPRKLSARLSEYPGFKSRNPIATELKILGGLFFEDIENSPEVEVQFLKDAYCQSGALSQYALVSKELLRSRYTTFFEKQAGVSALPATDKKGTNPKLTADILAASLSKRPILLVGDVGVGKTTFIRNLVKVDAKEEFNKALVLYLDYGVKPALSGDLKKYTSEEIVRQLREGESVDIFERNFVRGAYHSRLVDFGKGIYGDLKETAPDTYRLKEIDFLGSLLANEEEHVRHSLDHIFKGQRRQVVIFLDNVDQRPPTFQEEVFLIATSMAATWPVTAFVSLRPETFSMSRARGALAAYQPRVFTIEPPRIDLVIKKRLEFALSQLVRSGSLPGLGEGITLGSDNLKNYLRMLIRAFDSQNDIIEFIDNMCAGNVREALNYVGSFVGSGHVDSGKILSIMEREGRYNLPLHEFLRAVIYKDAEHYDPADSPVPNVYDVGSGSSKEHFAMLLLLDYVERAGQVGGRHGFVERHTVLSFMQESGFTIEQSLPHIRRALEKALLSSPEGLKDEATDRLRITSAGAYSRKKLCVLFSYLDAVIVDTPIVDTEARGNLQDARSIEDRLTRAEHFVDYLDKSWSLAPELHDKLDWMILSNSARRQIAEIRSRLGFVAA
jgi:hypothetical protein